MTLGITSLDFNKHNAIKYLLILLGFFTSISVFISDLLIIGIIIVWVWEGNWTYKLQSIKSSNFSIAIILFFLFYVFGLTWGSWNLYSWQWISKQALLITAPIIISMSIEKKYIRQALLAFLAGMCVNAVASIGSYLEFWKISYHHYPNENIAIGFLDHFDHSIFLAFSAIIIIAQFIETNNIKLRIFYFTLTLLFLISLFLSHGRAGQYVFLVILGLFILVHFFQNPKYLIFSSSLIILLLVMINLSSSTFNARLIQGIQESKDFFNLLEYSSSNTQDMTVTDTSVGDRLTYVINYTAIAKDNFWIGCGTGNSINQYELLEDKIFPNVPARPPHNNYLFILCEVGVIGLLLWLNIFIQLFIDIYKQTESVKFDFVKFIFPIMFLLICLTDEYLVRHNPTLLFCFFTSLFCVRKDVTLLDIKL